MDWLYGGNAVEEKLVNFDVNMRSSYSRLLKSIEEIDIEMAELAEKVTILLKKSRN